MPAHEHDEAVAAVSHVPQLAASIVAARLRELPESAVGLAGQGLRDVTRIAASDPRLWTQILAGNAAGRARRPAPRARPGRRRRRGARRRSWTPRGDGALGTLSRVLEAGNLGHARIPGKHGAAPAAYEVVSVVVPDEPGSLARLLTDVGEAGINLEDLHLEHGLGQAVGIAEIAVVPASVEPLRASSSGSAGASTTDRLRPALAEARRPAGSGRCHYPRAHAAAPPRSTCPASSSPSTAPRGRASRASPSRWPARSATATSTPAPCTAR